MPHRTTEELKEGYHVFYSIVKEDNGYEKLALDIQRQINEAEKEFDIVFVGGPTYKDDGGNARAIYFASQAAVLTRKKNGKG